MESLAEAIVQLDLHQNNPAEETITEINSDATVHQQALTLPGIPSMESLTEASVRLDLHENTPAEEKIIESSLDATVTSGEPFEGSSAMPSGEEVPIHLMTLPREIRDQIYLLIYGGHHIHVKSFNSRISGFHMESMNGLLMESLRFHLESAEAGLQSSRALFHHGYWPANNLHHRVCRRVDEDLPELDCSGLCLNLDYNNSHLSLASLRTCRQLYEEARLVPYRFNSFEFSESNLLDFLRTRSPDQLSEVRRVKIVASMDRCRTNEGLTHWVSGCLDRTCFFMNLTNIILSAKYVSVDRGQLWGSGFLMTTPEGLCCHVVLGQEEPGVDNFWWTTQYHDGEYGLMRPTPDGPQDEPDFVNLLPSAPVRVLPLYAYP